MSARYSNKKIKIRRFKHVLNCCEELNEHIFFYNIIHHYFHEHGYDEEKEMFEKEFLTLKARFGKTFSVKKIFLAFQEKWETYAYETLSIQKLIQNFQHVKFNHFFEHLSSDAKKEDILKQFLSTFLAPLKHKPLCKSSKKLLSQFIFEKETEYAIDTCLVK